MKWLRLLCVLLITLLATSAFAQQDSAPVYAVGPLKITPISPTILLKKESGGTYSYSNISLRLTNTSSSEVSVILLKRDLKLIEEFGEDLIYYPRAEATGIAFSEYYLSNLQDIFLRERNKFALIRPGQYIDISVITKTEIKDPSGELYRTLRPRNVAFSGTLCVITIDNNIKGYPFRLTQLPVRVTTR